MRGESIFVISMWWRIIYGFLRVILGLALLNIVGTSILDIITSLMGPELGEDPSDVVYTFITHILGQHPLYVSYFIAIYFIFWGVLDMIISYNLIKHKMWAFPVSLVLIGGFIVYELIRLSYTHSLILLGAILIDALMFWLISHEYKKLQSQFTHAGEPSQA